MCRGQEEPGAAGERSPSGTRELRVPGEPSAAGQSAADSGAEHDAALEAVDTWQVAEQSGTE